MRTRTSSAGYVLLITALGVGACSPAQIDLGERQQGIALAVCTSDADCTAGTWCDVSASTCTPTLANGTRLPTDLGHTTPALDGTCTPLAAMLVCESGVCDTSDNKCGLLAGACTPLTLALCRSGLCSADGTCTPVGGCNLDSDCSGGTWCTETTHTCTAKLPNGASMPNDPPHTMPKLNATCSAQAAVLVCTSGVCDAGDHACGYAVGTGPCDDLDATVVCRTGRCSVNDTCMPIGGCSVDADCTGGGWCNETQHTCQDKLTNGAPIPGDPPHTAPTLNAKCTNEAAALVCQSGVCDTKDNLCGLADGSGPCNEATGAVLCRSARCNASGSCLSVECELDADCDDPLLSQCDTKTHSCVRSSELVSGGFAGGGFCELVVAPRTGSGSLLALFLVCLVVLIARRRYPQG